MRCRLPSPPQHPCRRRHRPGPRCARPPSRRRHRSLRRCHAQLSRQEQGTRTRAFHLREGGGMQTSLQGLGDEVSIRVQPGVLQGSGDPTSHFLDEAKVVRVFQSTSGPHPTRIPDSALAIVKRRTRMGPSPLSTVNGWLSAGVWPPRERLPLPIVAHRHQRADGRTLVDHPVAPSRRRKRGTRCPDAGPCRPWAPSRGSERGPVRLPRRRRVG